MLDKIQEEILKYDFENYREIKLFLDRYNFNFSNFSFAFGYCRYSSDLQTEASIKQQEEEQLEYAKKNNIIIVKFYCDEAQTGKKTSRENFQEMLSEAKKLNFINSILVWKTDRFARNTIDSLLLRRDLKKKGISLISITQPIANDNSPEGKLMTTLLAGMDEYYSENLASNVKRALKSNAKESKFNGGIPPLGYDIVDGNYVINEKEAEAVRKIFDMRAKGYSLIDISLEMNKLGYKTKRGTEFKKNSLYDLLKNEKYIGNYIYGKGTKDDHRNINENIIKHEGTIPAIINKEVFYMVNQGKQTNQSTASKNFYLLTGLIYCSKCGSIYTGTTQTTKKKNGKIYKNQYYRCSSNTKIGKCDARMIKKDIIENKVIDLLTNELLNNSTLEEIIDNVNNEYKKAQKDFIEDINLMQKNIDTLEKEADKLIDMCCKGFGTKKISDRLKEIEDKQEFLQEQINERKNIVEHDYITPEKVRKILKSELSTLNKKSQKEMKNFVQKWVKKIELTTTEAIVYLDLRR